MGLDILYQDEWLVAIDKPSGLLVHRSKIDRHETRFAIQLLRDQIGQYVFPVHRLDKPTSGVLLFALDPETARDITEQFTQRAIEKQYLAVVRGHTDDHGFIDKPLREALDPASDSRARQNKAGQQARTDYTLLARTELPEPVRPYPTSRYSLLRLRPTTGRRHQIRRHLNHIAHPIIGDVNHGDRYHNQFFRRQFNCHRLLLMAQSLEFTHPKTQSRIRLDAKMDETFTRVVEGLGWGTHR